MFLSSLLLSNFTLRLFLLNVFESVIFASSGFIKPYYSAFFVSEMCPNCFVVPGSLKSLFLMSQYDNESQSNALEANASLIVLESITHVNFYISLSLFL